MASIPKILILITAIIAINGEALEMNINSNRSGARVSYRDEIVKWIIPNDYDEIDLLWPSRTRSDVLLPSPKADTTNTKSVFSKHGSQRERRQALFKTKGLDSGSNSVESLASYSSPLRSIIRNRNRRSSTIPDESSNKNSTVAIPPTLVSSGKNRISKNKHLFVMILAALTTPYLLITPNLNYEERDDFYS